MLRTTRIIPGRRAAMFRLSCLRAEAVGLYGVAIEDGVSPRLTREWRTAFGVFVAVAVRVPAWDPAAGWCDPIECLVATCVSLAPRVTGRWRYRILLPARLLPFRWFQTRSILAETPKFSETDSTVSPLRIL